MPRQIDPNIHWVEWRACYGTWFPTESLTLPPQGSGIQNIQRWSSRLWRPTLLPLLLETYNAACAGDLPVIFSLEEQLHEALPGRERIASQTAALDLSDRYSLTYGDKLWRRYLRHQRELQRTGHLLTCTAIRAASFSLSPQRTAMVYLNAEAKGAGLPRNPGLLDFFLLKTVPAANQLAVKNLVA